MFGLDLFPIFERLDTDNDGKLTANDLVEFAMPRQPEYRALKKSPAGHWKRLIELLSLANECEGWLRKQVPQIHLEFPDLPLKKYLSNRFYRFSEKDLWYLNNRVGCEKVQDLRADLEAYVLSEWLYKFSTMNEKQA